MTAGSHPPLLSVSSLRTVFVGAGRTITAIDGITFDVRHGEIVAIVGESGSGKSVTALSILRLIPPSQGRITHGEIRFGGRDLLRLPMREMRAIRGDRIAMIFQEPMTSLNPVFTIGDQIGESLVCHQSMRRRDARLRAIDLLKRVGIPAPARRVDDYPHRLSGGMRQRAMIAMALACKPELLIADEPTTALDVTIQAQILDLLKGLQVDERMSMLLITHDLGLVADHADRVVVMFGGTIVEKGDARTILTQPSHPYTRTMVDIVRALGDDMRTLPKTVVAPSSPDRPGSGCAFYARCPERTGLCRERAPALASVGDGHEVACFNRVPLASSVAPSLVGS
jgi:oligopeptide/dipeptide ABC transporter ATP-binding protein